MALEQPISSGAWKRVSFFYTTMGRVKKRKYSVILPVHDEERPVLWRSLRERATKSQVYRTVERTYR